METKSLLFGLVGFLLGGLLAAYGGTAIHKRGATSQMTMGQMTMGQMTTALEDKTGDDFDKLFIAEMISHHQAAIDMAKLAGSRAKHAEVKQLADDIVSAQSKEIGEMRTWQAAWGYSDASTTHGMMNMNR